MNTPLVLLSLFFPLILGQLEECHPGLPFPGVTKPRGTINIVEGSTLEIFCILDLKNKLVVENNLDAHAIDFDISPKDRVFKNQLDIKSSISVVNESTAVLRISTLKPDSYNVECELNLPNNSKREIVCLNAVNVGTLPKDVSNFKCIATFLKSLNCTWEIEYNSVKTFYNLSYSVKLWGGQNFTCKQNKNSCELNGQNSDNYFPNKSFYYFYFNVTNLFKPDGIIYSHEIDHFSIVVPDRPTIKRVEGKSPTTLEVTWDFDRMTYFKAGFTHKIIVCVDGDDSKCNDPIFFKTKSGVSNYTHEFNVNYPFINYTVNVTMKSQTAKDTFEFWSKPHIGYGQTKPSIPVSPPKTDFGSFSMRYEPSNKISYEFYWNEIPELFWNGSNFRYIVEIKNNERVKVKEDILPNSAFSYIFSGQPNKAYYFEISSMNSEGTSSKSSVIRVSKNTSFITQPKQVTKIEYGNGTTLIRWGDPPSLEFKPISYTLFQCVKHITRQECSKDFKWTSLGLVTDFTVLMNESEATRHYFGVSANYEEFSSGIAWSNCLIFNNREPVESIKNLRLTADSTDSIFIQWDQECTYPSHFLKGYKINYCQVEYKSTKEACLEKSSSIILNSSDISYKLNGLKQGSTYKVFISLLFEAGEGSRSGSRFMTTDPQTALNSPVIIDVVNVTNSTATVHFSENNTKFDTTAKYFVLTLLPFGLGDDSGKILIIYRPDNDEIESSSYEFNITGLFGSTNYSLTLQVGTKMSSKLSSASSPLYFKTEIGASYFDDSQMPNITSTSKGHKISWSDPLHPGGEITAFVIKISKDGEFIETRIINISDLVKDENKAYHKEFEVLCDKSNITTQVKVITKLNTHEDLHGNWSREGSISCSSGKGNIMAFVIVGSLAGFVLLIITLLISIRCWDKLNKMRDINPKLPPFIEEVSMTRKSRKSSGGDTRPFDQKETDSVLIQMKQTFTSTTNEEDPNSELPLENGELSLKGEGESDDLRRPIPLHEVPNENDKMTAWLWQLAHNNSQPTEVEKPPLPNLQPLHGEESYLIERNLCKPLLNGQPDEENTESEETNSDLNAQPKERPSSFHNGHATPVLNSTPTPSYANYGAGTSRSEKPVPDLVSPNTQYITLEKMSQMKGEV